MKMRSYFFFFFLALSLISGTDSVVLAQQINIVPISHSSRSTSNNIQPRFPEQHEKTHTQDRQTTPIKPRIPADTPIELLSEFEQYISEKIDITKQQFMILQKYKIEFTQIIQPPPTGKIKVPVRIIEASNEAGPAREKDKYVIDAGFLIGEEEEMHTAFKILGIRSPFNLTSGLRQFGYELFRDHQTSFSSDINVPVGPGYVFGPGDEIRISVWGKVEGNWNVIINRDGNITLPKIGVIGINGLTFTEVKKLLYKEFSKYYTSFEMNVSTGALRTIMVYVVGNALKPGAYTISSLSTLVNALFEAGGPSKSGSLRDIQLKRNGQASVHFDMYDFLLEGNKENDLRLMSEDVIFIPSIGPVAAIAGSVMNPAIYELKGRTPVSQLLEMAGGLSHIAFRGRIQITRIIDQSRQTVFESTLNEIKDKDIFLSSGDIVKIFQVVQAKETVRLTGAVNRAGEYGFSPGMTVKNLISMAGGLKYYAYTKEAELIRMHISNEGRKTEKLIINLDNALAANPESNIALKENDYLFVRTVPEWTLYQTVTIDGEVRFPGTYVIKKGDRLSSLIVRAGGFTDKAYLRGSVFTRERIKKLQQKQIDEMVGRLERDILRAGAVETSAATSQDEAEIKALEFQQKRAFLEKLKLLKAQGRMVIVLGEPDSLMKTQYDLELEEKDSLFIPTNPQSVQVIGAVYNQTALIYDKKRSVSSYINLAGGFNEHANKKKTYILKIDGTAVNPRNVSSSISWDSDSNRWGFGKNLEPGDTIVVPEKLERIAWMRHIKDITQILYQIATAAGVLIVAY